VSCPIFSVVLTNMGHIGMFLFAFGMFAMQLFLASPSKVQKMRCIFKWLPLSKFGVMMMQFPEAAQ
jgi:hypothetical protein